MRPDYDDGASFEFCDECASDALESGCFGHVAPLEEERAS
jgi:hypothetical protein